MLSLDLSSFAPSRAIASTPLRSFACISPGRMIGCRVGVASCAWRERAEMEASNVTGSFPMVRSGAGKASCSGAWTRSRLPNQTAPRVHRRLKRYVVCLPFDLPGPTARGGRDQRTLWRGYVAEWQRLRRVSRAPLGKLVLGPHVVTTSFYQWRRSSCRWR
jgi:hypothetical protein